MQSGMKQTRGSEVQSGMKQTRGSELSAVQTSGHGTGMKQTSAVTFQVVAFHILSKIVFPPKKMVDSPSRSFSN